MRVLLQRVQKAKVEVDGKAIASIERGYLLLVGFCEGDDAEIASKMAEKILKLRVFEDENGKTNLSLSQVGGNILSVSQFTLYASIKEGNRPSFVDALRPGRAKPLFAFFNSKLAETLPSLQTGEFGADMKVSLLNDGPFTLMLDSHELFKEKIHG